MYLVISVDIQLFKFNIQIFEYTFDNFPNLYHNYLNNYEIAYNSIKSFALFEFISKSWLWWLEYD